MAALNRFVQFGILILSISVLAGCDRDRTALEPTLGVDLETTGTTPVDSSANRSQVWLEALPGSALGARVSYTLEAGKTGPRVGEIVLRLSPNLRFVAATAGKSLEDADKDLVAQPGKDGTVRLVFLSATNTSGLNSGDIATVLLERTSSEPGKVEFLLGKPLFAPEEANDGLLVGEPLSL